MTILLRQKPLTQVVRQIVQRDNGAWFDPEDMSTMFQDAAGTTPVTALEQPVGLWLDKSLESDFSGNGAINKPDGFDWNSGITFSAYRTAGISYTNFNIYSYAPAIEHNLYVSTSGSDTSGDGSIQSPFRSIKKAIQTANSMQSFGVQINISAGIYDRRYSCGGEVCNKNYILKAVNGDVVSSARFEPLTWINAYPGVYSTARSTVGGIFDELNLNSYGVASKLAYVSTVELVQSTPGSWYSNGSTLYIHTIDGRIPDNSVLVMADIVNCSYTGGATLFVDGITFDGGQSPFAATSYLNITSTSRLLFNNCIFIRATSYNGLGVDSVTDIVSSGCIAHSNSADGFNYHGTSRRSNAIEINCIAFSCGIADGVNNDNATTAHEDCRVIRFNGNYSSTIGPIVADINTSKSWNIGCTALNSLSSTGLSNAGFYVLDTGKAWLDGCHSENCTYDICSASTTSYIYQKTSTTSGSVYGNVSTYFKGNHATQSITASRPKLSARYNLLLNTENIGATSWVKSTLGSASAPIVSINYGIAPDGTQTAAKIELNVSGSTSSDRSFLSVTPNITPTDSVYRAYGVWLKSADENTYTVAIRINSLSTACVIGKEWKFFSSTSSSSADNTFYACAIYGSSHGGVTTSASANILMWHPQLNIGTSTLPYQRVNTATDYDSIGWPKYIKAEGVDDHFVLPYLGLYNNVSCSIIASHSSSSQAANGVIVSEASSTDTDTKYLPYRQLASAGNVDSNIVADNATVILDSTGAAYSGTKENIIESIIDSGTSIETYRSGVLLSNEPYTRSAVLTLNNTTLFGSVSTTNTNFLNTKLHGLIITKSNLSARDRSLCETYLKSKVQVLQV